MKNRTIKSIITTGMAVIFTTAAFATGDMKAAMEHIRTGQQKVNDDLSQLNRQQQTVKKAGERCRTEKTSAAHNDYRSAMATLRDYKKQLRADNKQLNMAHMEHIKIHKEEVRAERKVLQQAQYKLDRDKIMGRAATLPEADKLMNARAEMRNRLTDLERARLERDKDNWVVMHESMDMGAKSNMQLASANSYSGTNTAQK